MLILSLLFMAAQAGDPAIESHLLQVVTTLRAETPANLNPEARASRLELLDLLDGYAISGEYPHHSGPAELRTRHAVPPRQFDGPGLRSPLFVDEDGTHCAVGYLMAVTEPALVDRIVAAENDAYVLDMQTPGIGAWATEHGFTADELAWIQPSYANYPIPNCKTHDSHVMTDVWDTYHPDAQLKVYSDACHTCGGPLSAFIQVRNEGGTPSVPTTVRFQLGVLNNYKTPPTGEVLATITIDPVQPGHPATVGTIDVEGSLNRMYNEDLDLYVVVEKGTTFTGTERHWDPAWAPTRRWHQMLYPTECDEVRDPEPPPGLDTSRPGEDTGSPGEDTGSPGDTSSPEDTGSPGDAETDPKPKPRACAVITVPASGVGLFVVLGVLWRRRRKARLSPINGPGQA